MNIRTGHAAGRTGLEHARRHVDLITGSPDTSVCVRLIRDLKSGRANQPASNLIGSIATLWPRIQAAQTEGHGAFLVVNEGGHRGDEITRIRAAFVDADGLPLPDAWEWHVTPDFLVRRDRAHWHAYWVVTGLALNEFKSVQLRLAARYGTDRAVCDLPRVMRLAGTLHQKDPDRLRLVELDETIGGAR